MFCTRSFMVQLSATMTINLMLFFVRVLQENSEDDKKRGRSTDSEVSQVSLKTLIWEKLY